jgi:hypothetical protein
MADAGGWDYVGGRMSLDSERMYQGVLTSQWLWKAPVIITISILLTIKVLGIAGVAGAALMIAAMIFQVRLLTQGTKVSSVPARSV